VSGVDSAPSVMEAWFGAAFAALHPQLQALHRDGGVLKGLHWARRFNDGRELVSLF
jgi:hypothetical protein